MLITAGIICNWRQSIQAPTPAERLVVKKPEWHSCAPTPMPRQKLRTQLKACDELPLFVFMCDSHSLLFVRISQFAKNKHVWAEEWLCYQIMFDGFRFHFPQCRQVRVRNRTLLRMAELGVQSEHNLAGPQGSLGHPQKRDGDSQCHTVTHIVYNRYYLIYYEL